MSLGIILLPLLAKYRLICKMWAFQIIHDRPLRRVDWAFRFGLEARGLGASSGVLLLWAWRVGLRAHFSNPISGVFIPSTYQSTFPYLIVASLFHQLINQSFHS